MTDATPALDVPPRVLDFLREHTTMTLATASPTGVPRATTLRFVNDGLTLYIWTRSQSWTAKQIEQNPLVSFTISEESAGLQGTGEARVVLGGDEVAHAVELFADKFPTALSSSTMNISFFRIAPTDIKLVDETYAGGRGETQMFAGAEYHVEHVYNVVRDLPADEIGLIAGSLHRVELGSGEVVARQGAPADKFVIVLEGEVEVTREGDSGAEQVTTLGPGDFFGEVAILGDRPRSATLTAAGDTVLLTMDSDEFRSVVGQSLGLAADFDRLVRERLGGGEGS
jgi:nitroimidazol reductase NimA-like FMN-containing flavoprotein (pyridoxamine 5'-phosphate oxidase superfamily)